MMIQRREFLADVGLGFTGLALGSMLHRDGIARASTSKAPTGKPHLQPKAKNVIWLFMIGGVSQMESFDPKPALEKYGGMSMDDTPFKDAATSPLIKNLRVVNVGKKIWKNLYPPQVNFCRAPKTGMIEVLGGKYDAKPIEFKVGSSTGRRLALAKWLTDRRQPLTARVAVNHIWLRHFGAPLVDNVFDFGLRAEKPPQAALLDYLAVEFMESGWSMKKLHRLMVTSNAYRMRTANRDSLEANQKADRDNRWWWHMNDRRLEAEAIRDSILHLAGNLDTKMGGPEIPLTEGETSRRRSIYFRHAHERQIPFLSSFDGASALECYRRATTVVPQQALALFNSKLPREQAWMLAEKLDKDAKVDETFINSAFETVLTRPPSAAERERCLRFLADQAKIVADPKRARENLLHSLFNHSDFVTVR